MSAVRRGIVRASLAGGVLLVVATVVLVALAWEGMGLAAAGERLERMQRSAQYRDGVFHNAQPLWNDYLGSLTTFMDLSPVAVPAEPLPVHEGTAATLATPPGRLRVTWLGHSTTVIEMGGQRLLTDPVFGGFTSPISGVGAGRWYDPPIPLEGLRDVDVVLLSHDHYDHLDHTTIVQMTDWKCRFVAPLGVGAHLQYWGIAAERITELDWWDETRAGDVRIVATPARHASGRHVFDQNHTLWAGFALVVEGKEGAGDAEGARVFYSGDTGLFDAMTTIGERFGPFDIVMIEIGAYNAAWPDWHIGPEQAIRGHKMLRGELFLPVHWGLFNLATHGWTEPIERVAAAATAAGVRWAAPRPGGSVSPLANPDAPASSSPERWWPSVPWKTAQEDPVISTRNGDPTDRYDVETP